MRGVGDTDEQAGAMYLSIAWSDLATRDCSCCSLIKSGGADVLLGKCLQHGMEKPAAIACCQVGNLKVRSSS